MARNFSNLALIHLVYLDSRRNGQDSIGRLTGYLKWNRTTIKTFIAEKMNKISNLVRHRLEEEVFEVLEQTMKWTVCKFLKEINAERQYGFIKINHVKLT